MPMRPPETGLPQVMFLGTFGDFSLLPLTALLEAGFPILAVVVPRSGASEPAAGGVRRVGPAVGSRSSLTLLEAPAAPNIVHLAC